MLSTLYRMTIIFLLCLFFFACSNNLPRHGPPEWAISRIPPYGGKNAAVGCSTHINTPEQENEAKTIALRNLVAQLEGVIVDGKTDMVVREKNGMVTSDIKVTIGTDIIQTTISAIPRGTWRDPAGNESCVWMTTNNVEGPELGFFKKWGLILLNVF